MNKVEMLKKVIEGKKAEVEMPVVYTGRIEEGQWVAEGLKDRYKDFVKTVEVIDDEEPAKVIDGFVFMGGNANRVVYIRDSVVDRWLEVSNQDSHWGAAAMLRPGKLARESVVFNWSGYREDTNDAGVLAILSESDWNKLVRAYELPSDTRWAQVTVFDLERGVSGKGTLRVVLPGEQPVVYPESWKRFGTLDTNSMAVLTVDAVYRPRASINVQELQYWTRDEQVSQWVWAALEEEIARILEYRTTPWTTTGYLQAFGFSPAWNITIRSLQEHLEGELRKLLRRIKLNSKYGLRAKTTSSQLLKHGEVLLPKEAKRHTQVGDSVWVSRNPALPDQGWAVYKVAGYHEGNFVVFAQGDKQWSALLGGDHDGDDAVVLYKSPVNDYQVPEGWIDLQTVKPSGRKLEGNTVEERLARWRNEVSVNIGVFDLAARRLLAVNKLGEDERKLFTIAIQTVISLKKRVAKLEEQPWYPILQEYMKLAQQVSGSTWIDALREGYKPVGGPEWAVKLWTEVMNAVAKVNKIQPRLWLTEEKTRAFARDVKPQDLWVYEYLRYLKTMKTEAIANDDGQVAWELNREIKEFVHVWAPEYLMTINEEDWKQFSRWAIGNMHSSEWVFLVHPEVLEELYNAFGKETLVAMVDGEHTLAVGDIFEIEEEEAINRKFSIDGSVYTLLDDTGFIKAGVQYVVTKIRKRVVEFTVA